MVTSPVASWTTAGVAGARFDLLVRGWGQPSSRVLMRPLTNSHGSIGMAKLQMRRTEYQMSLPQTVALGRCRSALVVVKVRTKVTMSAPAQAATGRQIEVSGATTPAKPGTAVTLWRVRPGAETRLDRGTVTKNGTYALAKKARRRGSGRAMKVAAARGNLAGGRRRRRSGSVTSSAAPCRAGGADAGRSRAAARRLAGAPAVQHRPLGAAFPGGKYQEGRAYVAGWSPAAAPGPVAP